MYVRTWVHCQKALSSMLSISTVSQCCILCFSEEKYKNMHLGLTTCLYLQSCLWYRVQSRVHARWSEKGSSGKNICCSLSNHDLGATKQTRGKLSA